MHPFIVQSYVSFRMVLSSIADFIFGEEVHFDKVSGHRLKLNTLHGELITAPAIREMRRPRSPLLGRLIAGFIVIQYPEDAGNVFDGLHDMGDWIPGNSVEEARNNLHEMLNVISELKQARLEMLAEEGMEL